MASFYTDEELRLKIIALDTKLEEGYTQGRLDSRMSEQEWRASMEALRQQRDYYLDLWKTQTGDDSLGQNVTMLPSDDWIC